MSAKHTDPKLIAIMLRLIQSAPLSRMGLRWPAHATRLQEKDPGFHAKQLREQLELKAYMLRCFEDLIKRRRLGKWRSVEVVLSEFFDRLNQRKDFQKARTSQVRKKGDETREKVERAYRTSALPARDRASAISQRLGLSPAYVRRIIKEKRMK